MNLYEELGVSRDASMEEIKKAFRGRAHETHPDKGGSEEKFKKIVRAKEILLDKYKRKEYDRMIFGRSVAVWVMTSNNDETKTTESVTYTIRWK